LALRSCLLRASRKLKPLPGSWSGWRTAIPLQFWRKIRLSGIDAPERGQAFGNQAKQAMGVLAFGKKAEADCHKVDRYGRDVCVVCVDGKDVGLRLVEQGQAWHYTAYQRDQTASDRLRYAQAESEAREARAGLWRDSGSSAPPVPPWEWRKAKKTGDAQF
jgi:endonuclease YncB( thermonuclease family)